MDYVIGRCLMCVGRRREAVPAFERLLDKAPLFARDRLRQWLQASAPAQAA